MEIGLIKHLRNYMHQGILYGPCYASRACSNISRANGATFPHYYYIVHRVRKKEATVFLGITWTNLDSLVIFGTNHSDTSAY